MKNSPWPCWNCQNEPWETVHPDECYPINGANSQRVKTKYRPPEITTHATISGGFLCLDTLECVGRSMEKGNWTGKEGNQVIFL